MNRSLNYALVAITAMLTASSALAHHSHAMFDTTKQVTLVEVHPLFDSLRGDPRFDDLVKRIGIPN